MTRQIIKQPDNKYALWSTITDSFIVIDATASAEYKFAVHEK